MLESFHFVHMKGLVVDVSIGYGRFHGIGGHINPEDDMPLFCNDFRESYLSAVKREVAEEVNVDADYTDRIVALLNDDSNEVGQVHLGIVHCWFLDEPKVSKREQMITQMSFMTPSELQDMRESLETWSSLCVVVYRILLTDAFTGKAWIFGARSQTFRA